MKCFFCDENLSPGTRYCPSCGAEIPESASSSDEEVVMAPENILDSGAPVTYTYKAPSYDSQTSPAAANDILGFSSGNDPNALSQISGWNWGAFIFTWIWCFLNGMPLIGVIMLFFSFSPLGFVGAVLLGLKGNELLWKKVRFGSIQDFRRSQENWNRAAMLLLFITISLLIMASILGLSR